MVIGESERIAAENCAQQPGIVGFNTTIPERSVKIAELPHANLHGQSTDATPDNPEDYLLRVSLLHDQCNHGTGLVLA